MIDLTLPPLDESTATIERYYVQPGDSVSAGQPLVVVVTTRFEWDVPATTDGVIAELVALPGDSVTAGQVIARLAGDSSDPARNGRATRVTPLARRIAVTHGIDLAAVSGSGPGGRVTRGDVVARLPEELRPALAEAAFNSCFSLAIPTEATITAPPPRESARTNETRASDSAAGIAPTQRTLTHAQRLSADDACLRESMPYAITAVEADMSRVLAYVESRRARLMRRGMELTPLACVTHTTAQTIPSHRLVNGAWSDDGIILRGRINIGVRTQRSVAEVENATDWSTQGIARRLGARDHHSTALPKTTFTIHESFGARWQYAPPAIDHAAALTLGAIESRPRVIEQHGPEIVAIRPMAILTLAYDGRVMTQADADAFLIDLQQRLEHFDGL